VGPEIVLRALSNIAIYDHVIPLVVGSLSVLRRVGDVMGDSRPLINVRGRDSLRGIPETVEVYEVPIQGQEELIPGRVQRVGGLAADAYIRTACELARRGEVDAIVTAPISKESLRLAGIRGIGHTELLAEYLESPDPLTVFITGKMWVFFLSRHLSLRKAIDYITEERLLGMIRRVDKVMKRMGFRSPRIGVAALNPHASDGGQFGDEEAKVLAPAIKQACREGIRVVGPVGADSIFYQALEGWYDCVISLYHDQGHIAAKTRDFFGTVTATLGLPVLRTSVDHGTAFDIAWKGKANATSMETAILKAAELLNRIE